jgi:hypothetical protein
MFRANTTSTWMLHIYVLTREQGIHIKRNTSDTLFTYFDYFYNSCFINTLLNLSKTCTGTTAACTEFSLNYAV